MTQPLAVVDFPGAPRRVFHRPLAVLEAATLGEVPAVIEAAERAAAAARYVVGFVAYEAAPAFEPAMSVRAGGELPLAWFGVFGEAAGEPPRSDPIETLPGWQFQGRAEGYLAHVERIRAEIARGRTYQVNLTARLAAAFDVSPFGFYEHLRRAQGAGYHAYLDTGRFVLMSASPELFFKLRGRRIRARPMKGTRPRGRWLAEDEALARELAGSEKDRAENLMIVDVVRNDIGRIARTGSVRADRLYELERYRTVHQLTSTVSAEFNPGVTLGDVLAALFPCASVTGAPKISTMQLIAELEDTPRGVYCGAIGVLEPGGDATFNVPIRTACLDRSTGQAVYGTGGGITWDSNGEEEYRELQAKAGVLVERWPEFELLETMRVEGRRVLRLDGHVARLLESGRYFDFAVTEAAIRAAAQRAAASAPAPMRLRLLAGSQGDVRTELHPLAAASVLRLQLAHSPVASTDRFLFHKTTNRRAYDEKLAECPGADDVLLWNERGELTEFTRGNLVLELDGVRCTPPRESGLLAGVFRGELLARGELRERTLHLPDLDRATRAWLINSVREWVEVVR